MIGVRVVMMTWSQSWLHINVVVFIKILKFLRLIPNFTVFFPRSLTACLWMFCGIVAWRHHGFLIDYKWLHMTTNDDKLAHRWRQMRALLTESFNYFKTNNILTKHFLKVKYTCTLYSGMTGSIYEKKDLTFFFTPRARRYLSNSPTFDRSRSISSKSVYLSILSCILE